MRAVFIVLFCFTLVAARKRIIAGTSAIEQGSPNITWHIGIEGDPLLCGGVMIAPSFVLTAAQCLKSIADDSLRLPSSVVLTPGISLDSADSAKRNVKRYWVEPSYASSVPFKDRVDLAVIEVIAPFDIGQGFAPIGMCNDTLGCHAANASQFITGYGRTISDNATSTVRTLRWANLTAVSSSACTSKYDENFCSGCKPRNYICAASDPSDADPAKDNCFGDGGGGLVQQIDGEYFVAGVISSGTVPAGQTPLCGKPGEYGLYSSIAYSRSFIDPILSGQNTAASITNVCVAAGNCAAFPGAPIPTTTTGGSTTTPSSAARFSAALFLAWMAFAVALMI